MKLINNGLFWISVMLVIFAAFTDETEAVRRKILRGRKTITRTYYRGLAIPAWAIITITGLSNLIIGAALYIALRYFILKPESENQTTYAPAGMSEM